MKFREKKIDKVKIFEIYDNFFRDTGISELQESIMAALNNGSKKFIMDLSRVEYINSIGLAALIRAYTSTKKAGADLLFTSLSLKVKEMLYITRIDTLFTIYDTTEEAVAKLKKT